MTVPLWTETLAFSGPASQFPQQNRSLHLESDQPLFSPSQCVQVLPAVQLALEQLLCRNRSFLFSETQPLSPTQSLNSGFIAKKPALYLQPTEGKSRKTVWNSPYEHRRRMEGWSIFYALYSLLIAGRRPQYVAGQNKHQQRSNHYFPPL